MFGTHVKRLACLTLLAVTVPAANKKDMPIGTAGDEWVEMKADIYLALDEVHAAVGGDVPAGIVAVKVSIKPRGNEKLRLDVEDFQQRSDARVIHAFRHNCSQVGRNGRPAG